MDFVKAIEEITLLAYSTLKEFNASALVEVASTLNNTPLIKLRCFHFHTAVDNEEEQRELFAEAIAKRLREAGYSNISVAFLLAPSSQTGKR
jgi:hypothetical protein